MRSIFDVLFDAALLLIVLTLMVAAVLAAFAEDKISAIYMVALAIYLDNQYNNRQIMRRLDK